MKTALIIAIINYIITGTNAVAAAPVKPLCNILAFSGGGSYGAVELGMFEGLLETNSIPQMYDVVTGISAGGLNAGFFSYYDNVTQALNDIKPVYFDLSTSDVFNLNLFDIFGEWSLANTAPLRKKLSSVISGKQQIGTGPVTLIGASNVNTRSLDVFHFGQLTNVNDKLDVLMATSAIPVLFPPQKINGSVYVDGGAISNEMIIQALLAKECKFYNVVFLSAFQRVGTVKNINNVLEYGISLVEMILSTFDYQMAQFSGGKCDNPIGQIMGCYPNSPDLIFYSPLDFNHGQTIFNLGKSSYNCTTIDLCLSVRK